LAICFIHWLSFYFAGHYFSHHISQQKFMTEEILILNTFFSYFFIIGDKFFVFLGGAIIVGIVASLIEFLLAKE
jgi:hypothetical protein